MVKKTCKPKALEVEDGDQLLPTQTPEEFAREFFGDTAEPQDGLPPLSWLKDNYRTKSAAIRYLIHLGHPVNLIAKHLGVKYQHVRNVAHNPLKRGPNEDWRPKSERQPLPTLAPTKKGDPQ